MQTAKECVQRYNIETSNASSINNLKAYLFKALKSSTVSGMSSFIKFLRDNNLEADDLYQKNPSGFTPLALAKRHATEVIPFIERRTSISGLFYHYANMTQRVTYDNKEALVACAAIIASSAAAYTLTG